MRMPSRAVVLAVALALLLAAPAGHAADSPDCGSTAPIAQVEAIVRRLIAAVTGVRSLMVTDYAEEGSGDPDFEAIPQPADPDTPLAVGEPLEVCADEYQAVLTVEVGNGQETRTLHFGLVREGGEWRVETINPAEPDESGGFRPVTEEGTIERDPGDGPVDATTRGDDPAQRDDEATGERDPEGARAAEAAAECAVGAGCGDAGEEPPPGIYVVGADGSDLRAVADGEPSAVYPAWSPDGAKIAFLADGDGGLTLHVAGADGSTPRPLADLPLDDVPPSWSPDGRRLLAVSADGGIYAVAADGSGATRLTEQGSLGRTVELFVAGLRRPSWSPDGSTIAFPAMGADGDGTEIHVMSANGSGRRPLTDLPAGVNALAPSWSPDGARLAFSSLTEPDQDQHTDVVGADGTGLRRVADDWGEWASNPWSPDGEHLLLTRYIGDGATSLYRVGADGRGRVELTGQGFYSSPSWSPDGGKIAYSEDGDLYVMDANGAGKACLVGGPAAEGFPSWSPDGARIAFSRGPVYLGD